MAKFKLCPELKVMRDPVHGYIHVRYQVIWDLINAPEFQRLRRIHQLGGSFQVYHGAEHSRFSHSVGVYEVARLMLEWVEGLQNLSEFERVAVLCAALLHDIGHGPYSHSFESVSKTNHEEFTDRIILEETQIHKILKKAHPKLPQFVADIIAHRSENKLLTQMISSQLDADRMDYLLRDSYFTGVSYGEFDLYRILRTLRVVEGKLAVKESGIHAVEDYIMARYQMYWQVYYHPVARSFDAVLVSLFKRMSDLDQINPRLIDDVAMFRPFLNGQKPSLEDHFRLDEASSIAGFMRLTRSKDPILSDLSQRLLNRKLFQYEDIEEEQRLDDLKKKLESKNYDPKYYLAQDAPKQILYSPYTESGTSVVWVASEDGLKELSQMSNIVKGFVSGEDKEDHKVFYPEEVMQ